MLRWALFFLIVSIIAGALGYGGVEIVSADIAKAIFFVFLILFLLFVILGLSIFKGK